MNALRTCPQCGAPLPAGAPEWLCSRCLLAQAAEDSDGGEPRWREASPVLEESLAGPFGRALPCRLGDYELVERIGQGGMGVVYRARQVHLDRDVAVKVLSPSALGSPEAVSRFQMEAVTAASLQHPNIVAVHEAGHVEGLHFLVMDYVAGPTLGDLVRNGPLPIRQAILYLRTIAAAVHFAHEHGVLHRDLKPSNVLLDANHQPRVTDFGLAKRLPGSRSSTLNPQLTCSGQVLGSPAFIPPEQASGERGRVGRPSDVYALGAILYQLLTGRPPFVGEALADLLRQVLNKDPLSPRLLNPAVPHDLETVCLKCLEKEPDRRYPTAQALAEELGRWLENRPILARHLGAIARTWRWCRRNPRLAGLAAALALTVVGGFVGILSQLERAKAAELTARRHAYASDMNRAQQTLDADDLNAVQGLLDRHRPARASSIVHRPSPNQEDLRGWEWRYLWVRSRSEDRLKLHHYPGAVSALGFSSDGKWMAVRSEADTLELWDASAKRVVLTLAARPQRWRWRNKALAFSPQGNLMAWGTSDANGSPTVSIRDLAGQRDLRSLPHPRDVVSLAFGPDAKLLATLGDDGLLTVWNVESGEAVRQFEVANTAHARLPQADSAQPTTASRPAETTRTPANDRTYAPSFVMRARPQTDHYGGVAFSPDGRWLAAGAAQPSVQLWDWSAGKEASPLTLGDGADGITALAFSPDSTQLAASGAGGANDVHVWELASRSERRLSGHRSWVGTLAFSPDGLRLASGSADQTTRLWDLASGQERRRLRGNTDQVWALAWSPDGHDLVTGSRDGAVRYWDPNSEPRPACIQLPTRVWSFGLAFTPDSRTLLTVNRATTTIEAWDLTTVQRDSLPSLGTGHRSLDVSHDGRWLALVETNEHVRVWDLHHGRFVADLGPAGSSVLVVRFTPRDGYLTCGTRTSAGVHVPRLWEVPAWREVSLDHLHLTNVFGLDVSPDERTLAIGHDSGTAVWLDLATGARRAFPTRQGGGMHVKFSTDGRWFVTAGVMNGLMTLCDLADNTSRPVGPNLPYLLHTLGFTPGEARLVTSGSSLGDLFHIWDVATGQHLLSLPAATDGFYTRIGFSPDGNTLFAASFEGTTLLWRAPSWAEIEAAEQKQGVP